jgi:hypothetical protein
MDVKMDHSNDTLISVTAGVIGGMIKWFTLLGDVEPFSVQLFHAGITALCCGFLAALGKWAWGILIKSIKQRK